ncbi:MAG: hypothetical protein IT362_04785 [Deltaproteobacteria bacterium]|nr:hypothetical protein [Deltaproteobacteria bacterium]
MKRFLSVLLFASAMTIVPNVAVFAADALTETETIIIDEVGDGIDDIDNDASTAAGESAVVGKIVGEFGVDEALIQDLRAQKLGYGEITLALSLAERLPGGITDENLDKVLDLRQGPPVQGWGNVARSLDLSLKPSSNKLEKIGEGTSKGEGAKNERLRHEKTEKIEKAERAQKQERIERIERVERPERPEKGGKK